MRRQCGLEYRHPEPAGLWVKWLLSAAVPLEPCLMGCMCCFSQCPHRFRTQRGERERAGGGGCVSCGLKGLGREGRFCGANLNNRSPLWALTPWLSSMKNGRVVLFRGLVGKEHVFGRVRSSAYCSEPVKTYTACAIRAGCRCPVPRHPSPPPPRL